MADQNWQKIKDVFVAALEKEPRERAPYLDECCGGDRTLRQEVETLLDAHSELDDFIEQPAFKVGDVFAQDDQQREKQFGSYRIIREIGVGGMGAVFLAERVDGEFEHQVAIKIIRQTMVDSDLARRFRRERQILASLNHPNIARLLDGGVTETGTPFLVMEYVKGEALTTFAQDQQLDLNARLHLFLDVCGAVAYAHRNLIVHRDLKPNNILVSSEGAPKLLDFGLAKLLDGDLTSDVAETQTGFRALTPAYASPEQFTGEAITTASDIYSLGTVFYELLTNERPFNFEGKNLEQIIRSISGSQPPLPSSVKQQDPKAPAAKLAGDLDNIALKALRKEPERRYQSAEQFADDVERYLNGRPVLARPSTFRYRAEKFVLRNRVAVATASLVVLAVLAGLVATVWQSRVAARERDQARLAQARAEQLNTFLQSILSAASPEEKGKDAKVIEVLNDAAQNIDAEFVGQPESKAQALLTIGQTYIQLGLMDEAEKMLRPALKLNLELYGESNHSTAASQAALAVPLLNRSKFEEAEGLLKQAIATERKLSPVGTKNLAYALDVLGELYVQTGAFDKAKPLLEESVKSFDRLLGIPNADSAFARISLGRAYAYGGDPVGAENAYRNSVATFRQLPARYLMRLGIALVNLGYLLVNQGNYADGISMIDEADSIFVAKQGDSYPTFESKSYLSNSYFFKGDLTQSVAYGIKAIALGRKLKLDNTSDFVAVLENVGTGLTRRGKPAEGEPFLREAVKITTDSPAKNGVSPAFAGSRLGECLVAQRKFAEAEPLLIKSSGELNTRLGPRDPRTIAAFHQLFL
ncbi:MAG: protein kinase, partial [Pyrinomonadaceae bacterium]